MRPQPIRDRLIHWQRYPPTPLLHASLTLLQPLLWGAAVWTWYLGWYWATAAVWVASTIRSAISSLRTTRRHRLLQPIHWLNELIGQILGLPYDGSAHRLSHRARAAPRLSRDGGATVEFWPFVDPTVPRWRRMLAVVGELLFGYFYDPYVFLARRVCGTRHSCGTAPSRVSRIRRCGARLVCSDGHPDLRGWWFEFCVAFFIPGYVAACLNSARRMTEHLGMLGDTIEENTRTIIPAGRGIRNLQPPHCGSTITLSIIATVGFPITTWPRPHIACMPESWRDAGVSVLWRSVPGHAASPGESAHRRAMAAATVMINGGASA